MITIKRTGMDPIKDFGPLVRNDIGAEVTFHQNRLTKAALARGDMTEGAISRAIQVGNTRRKVESYAAVKLWPWPPFAAITASEASSADLREAAEEGIRLFRRNAPRGGNAPKVNNSYRYHESLRILVSDREYQALPPVGVISLATTITLVNVAPHSSPVELRKPVMEGVARALTAEFPSLAISYGWLNSDAVGLRYGKGTGGPVDRETVYALPYVEISVSGFARIARRRDAPRRRRRR